MVMNNVHWLNFLKMKNDAFELDTTRWADNTTWGPKNLVGLIRKVLLLPINGLIRPQITTFLITTNYFNHFMGEISPIAAKNIEPEQFDLFKSDLASLLRLVTQDELGKRMGINKSNVNKYVRGHLPVTRTFLKKFYAVWGNRIKAGDNQQEMSAYPFPYGVKEPSMRDIMTILQRLEKKIDAQAYQPPKEN
jgi:transcriptional regulator with XRE-family HTH domain